MKKIHVYKVNGQPHCSAAEVVLAILSKEPIGAICHSVSTDIQGALLAAIARALSALRYRRARNIHAGMISLALLSLLAWPFIYNAISLPEMLWAARITTGACFVLSLLAALSTIIQAQLIRKYSSAINTITIDHRDDRLLPPATAWGQRDRCIPFPWLGLGLILFTVALNCVVVADYAHPAVLSNGSMRYNVGLVAPWAVWTNNTRYIEDSFYATYSYNESTDEFYVLHVTYRVENADLTVLPPDGIGAWLVNSCSRMVNYAVENIPTSLPPDASDEDVRFALAELFEYNEYRDGFVDALKTKWAERYPSNLKLVSISYKLLVVTRAEAVKDYEQHKD